MAAGRFMKVIWMYAAGLALIFIGLYVLAFMPSLSYSGPLGFGLMVSGLFLSMVGGIYGKKKLLETSGEKLPAVETRQIDQLKQNVVSQLKPPETADPPAEPPKIEEEHALPEAMAVPSQSMPSQPAPAPVEGVVKILMCPGCDTENPPTNMFCFNCGKRLRAAKKSGKAKARKKKPKPVKSAPA
jgi:hypothetical protein